MPPRSPSPAPPRRHTGSAFSLRPAIARTCRRCHDPLSDVFGRCWTCHAPLAGVRIARLAVRAGVLVLLVAGAVAAWKLVSN